jgi:predicted transcriptional regulator of viral defense system
MALRRKKAKRRGAMHPLLALPELAKHRGLIGAADLDELGIWRGYLHEFARRGLLARVGWGLYTLPGREPSRIAIASKSVEGVLCLISALYLQKLIPKEPDAVWLAIGPKARQPSLSLPVRVVRFSGAALTGGIETVVAEDGVAVRTYSVEKTIADCFKFRNKIGVAVAVGALERSLLQKRCDLKRLKHFAVVCRVARVIEPYLLAFKAFAQ